MKMYNKIYYIKPRSLFPRELHSNTLFGAICIGMRELYGEEVLEDMINSFRNEHPFVLSSAFPFAKKDKKKHHFFPKPIVEPEELSEEKDGNWIKEYYDSLKDYKKIKFMHEDIFYDFINGKTNEKEIIKNLDKNSGKYKLINNKTVIIKAGNELDEKDFLISIQDTPHNVLNRLSGESENFYYSTGSYFKNSGLFFLINFLDESYKEKIDAVLGFIEDRGFGGDLSTGSGQFEIENPDEEDFSRIDSIINNKPDEANRFLILSLYCPQAFDGFDKNNCWYDLKRIRGKFGCGLMKKPVFMFCEGSTFPENNDMGKIVDVGDDTNKSVEYGLAYKIGMKK